MLVHSDEPVVNTLCFYCRGLGFNPRTEFAHALWCGQKKKKKPKTNKKKRQNKNMMRYHFPSYQISKIFKDS